MPPLCLPIPSAWTVLPPAPELPPAGAATAEAELNRLTRLDVYSANLHAFARRLVEWECGEGPSAQSLRPSEAREIEALVGAYRRDVARRLDPDAPETFVWAPALAKCEAQPELFDCQRECLVRPERSWCDGSD